MTSWKPYYTAVEYQIGVAGDGDANPFVPRSKPLPMPPVRPFTMGEAFRQASERLGLHPYPTPVAVNSVPYNGFPATTYCAWSGGFGPFNDERWHPGLTWVPQALATGNFDLRTHCRVDPRSDRQRRPCRRRRVRRRQRQPAGAAGADGHPVQLHLRERAAAAAVGRRQAPRRAGQHQRAGRQASHDQDVVRCVDGYCPDRVFNRAHRPGRPDVELDDFISADVRLRRARICRRRHAQRREPAPADPDQPRGVAARCAALGHSATRNTSGSGSTSRPCAIQPDALPYHANYLDLDPRHRDRSGLGLPVVRITYDLQPNEHRWPSTWKQQAEEILRAMGATKTWRGPRFSGVLSSHELGGCRMGDDPAASVVDR